MEEYAWMKNKAVVDRLYYTEMVARTTTILGGFFIGFNLFYIKKGFFAETCRARIMPTIKYWAIANTVIPALLLAPLTKEEIRLQTRKRFIMGKWLYTLYHLEEPETPLENLPFRPF